MDRTQRSSLIAANAVLSLVCPWCAEPLRATVAELDAGISCPLCLVQIPWTDAPASSERSFVEPVAA
jgi:hypothetical protein